MRRSGYSLVELIAMMSTATILLTLATQCVHRTMRLHSQAQQHESVHRAALRLAGDFRRDVHRAIEVRIENRKSPHLALEMQMGDEVVYAVKEGRVHRTQQRADGQSFEEYSFPEGCRISFDKPEIHLAELHVQLETEFQAIGPKTITQVTAEIGRLLRLTELREQTP